MKSGTICLSSCCAAPVNFRRQAAFNGLPRWPKRTYRVDALVARGKDCASEELGMPRNAAFSLICLDCADTAKPSRTSWPSLIKVVTKA